MKLALGTVQFGLSYGAFNTSGQVSREAVASILQAAAEAGIDTLDTARAYGHSEDVLGSLPQSANFRVVTKCPPVNGAIALRESFAASQNALGKPIYGYLMHRAEALLGPDAEAIWAVLASLRDEGDVQRIGVSAYSMEELQAVRARFPITLAQLPANVLTPWYTDADLPPDLELHTRSAFLQGFLLSDPEALPNHFKPFRATLHSFVERAADLGLTPLQASLAPLLQSPAISRVVVGVDGLSQLVEILSATQAIADCASVTLGTFPEVTPALTDPRTW